MSKQQKHHWLLNQWNTISRWHILLIPISLMFLLISTLRRWAYKYKLFYYHEMPVPVIIVGNINVGGSGKTPFVIWLCHQLKKLGLKPAIIARGYGGHWVKNSKNSFCVTAVSDPANVGDEPVLMAQKTGCPVWIGRNRVKTAQQLLANHLDCDILISDDGLQHYALWRDLELVLIDGQREFGNGFCLPAGALREPISRLKSVDAIILNTTNQTSEKMNQFANYLDSVSESKTIFSMRLGKMKFYNLANHQNKINYKIKDIKNYQFQAFAGIGNPDRFFTQLKHLGLSLNQKYEYDDHYQYRLEDILNLQKEGKPLITTEKDAIKCLKFASEIDAEQFWVASVETECSSNFREFLKDFINKLKGNNKLWTLNY